MTITFRMLVGAAALATACVGSAHADDAVKIGVLTDMSSVYSVITGPGSVDAARMAVEDFGGRVLGAPIELVVADHQNKPDVGVTTARSWYENDDVDLIVDLPTSSVALAVSEFAAQANKLAIVSGGASEALTEASCNPNTLAWTWDSYAPLNALVTSLVDSGQKRWFFLGPDYAYGQFSLDQVTALLDERGGELVGSVLHPLNGNDFSSYLIQVRNADIDVLLIASGGTDMQNILKQANEFGVLSQDLRVVMQQAIITDVDSIGLEALGGLTAVAAFYWDLDDKTRAFAERFAERNGGAVPSEPQAGIYSAVTTYLNAVEAVGSDDPAAVVEWMQAQDIEDMFARGGKLQTNGRMIHDMYLINVKTPEESTEKWDYYEVIETIPGEEAFRPIAESTCAPK